MTLACTSICNETCPSAVSSVTLVQNQFIVNDETTTYLHQVVTASGTAITLPSNPVVNTFKLFKNGQLLTPTTDYTRSQTAVTLVVAASADDVYVADYLPEPSMEQETFSHFTGDSIVLSQSPVDATVRIYKNGSLLSLTTDYTVDDDAITLVVDAIITDSYVVEYIAE